MTGTIDKAKQEQDLLETARLVSSHILLRVVAIGYMALDEHISFLKKARGKQGKSLSATWNEANTQELVELELIKKGFDEKLREVESGQKRMFGCDAT